MNFSEAATDAIFDLIHWKDTNILLVGGMSGIAVVIVDLVLMKIMPAKYYDDGGLNERMFQKRSLLQIALIAAVVAIGEEILFRGVIQTHMGLILSSSYLLSCITAIYLTGSYLLI